MDIDLIIQTIAVYALPIIFGITLHEAAHGYVAKYFGDSTAYVLGRVTLNPIKHIDPIGTILIPVILAVLSQGKFALGFAKPVPVNFENLRNPKRDMIWVALAGPAANFIQAILWAVFGLIVIKTGTLEPFFMEVTNAGILVNAILFAFNLFPLPPLDGGRILTGLLPKKLAIPFARIEPYGFFIVLALIAFPAFRPLLGMWMVPLRDFVYGSINFVFGL